MVEGYYGIIDVFMQLIEHFRQAKEITEAVQMTLTNFNINIGESDIEKFFDELIYWITKTGGTMYTHLRGVLVDILNSNIAPAHDSQYGIKYSEYIPLIDDDTNDLGVKPTVRIVAR